MRAFVDQAIMLSEAKDDQTSGLNELRERLENRTLALAAVMHDLRRPLTRLRLRIEMLEDAARAELAGDVADMEAMIAASLNALCDVAIDEAVQWIDVNALLAVLYADFRRTGCKVALRGRAAAPYLGRPVMLRRSLSNLIDNAVKFAGAASIHVCDGSHVSITVKDRGPGIPHEEIERVFEPFYRAHHTRRIDGVGLGLWIAREGAAAHGGRLTLRNGARGGAEAELTLPRASYSTAAANDAQRSLRSVPVGEPPVPATNIV